MKTMGVLIFFGPDNSEGFVWCDEGPTGLYVIRKDDFRSLWDRLAVGSTLGFSAERQPTVSYVQEVREIDGAPVETVAS